MEETTEEYCFEGKKHEYYRNTKSGKFECRVCGRQFQNVYDLGLEKRTFGDQEDANRKRSDFVSNSIFSIFEDDDLVPTKKSRNNNGEPQTLKGKYGKECKSSAEKIKTICQTINYSVENDAIRLLVEYYSILLKSRSAAAAGASSSSKSTSSTKSKPEISGVKRYRADDDDDDDDDVNNDVTPSPSSSPSAPVSPTILESEKVKEPIKKFTKIRGDTDDEFLLAIIIMTLKKNGSPYDLNDLCKKANVQKKSVNNFIKKIRVMMPECDKCKKDTKGGNSKEYCDKLGIEKGEILCSVANFYDALSPCLEGCKPQTISGVAISLYFGRVKSPR